MEDWQAAESLAELTKDIERAAGSGPDPGIEKLYPGNFSDHVTSTQKSLSQFVGRKPDGRQLHRLCTLAARVNSLNAAWDSKTVARELQKLRDFANPHVTREFEYHEDSMAAADSRRTALEVLQNILKELQEQGDREGYLGSTAVEVGAAEIPVAETAIAPDTGDSRDDGYRLATFYNKWLGELDAAIAACKAMVDSVEKVMAAVETIRASFQSVPVPVTLPNTPGLSEEGSTSGAGAAGAERVSWRVPVSADADTPASPCAAALDVLKAAYENVSSHGDDFAGDDDSRNQIAAYVMSQSVATVLGNCLYIITNVQLPQ